MSFGPTVVNKTLDQVFNQLQTEGYISEWNKKERWYKRLRPENEIRERMAEIINDDALNVATMPDEAWRDWRYRYR